MRAQVARRGGGAVPVHYLKEALVFKHLSGRPSSAALSSSRRRFRAVAGVHHQIFHLKGNFRIKLERCCIHLASSMESPTAGDTDPTMGRPAHPAVILIPPIKRFQIGFLYF